MTLQARYTILRKVADGGTAEIFLATQHGAHRFEKPVILKRIFPAFYADPQFRNMLVDEAHIAMTLNHSNIVQVLDLGEADGQYVLALELVDGWSLDAVLRRARALKTSLPPPLALYMTAEVCRALAYAHAKKGADGNPLGIVHRDISPHNVLLSEQGEVKLTDFGIAKAHNRRESSVGNVIKGKIAYMSPEQASGAAIDARSDLFSVGTMLYVMICRHYPFDAPTDLEMLLLVKNGAYEPPEKAMPGLNPELYRVIRRALSKSPDERYQRAEEMLIDVEQVMRVAFRAVGQTELKRWLQDLSMRDGVPPLTRTPPAPGSAASGRLEGETLELKGVASTSGVIPTVSLPPPVSSRPPDMAAAGTAVTQVGKPRPAPPPAAMNVGKKTAPSAAAAGTTGRAPAPSAVPAFLARARSGPLPTASGAIPRRTAGGASGAIGAPGPSGNSTEVAQAADDDASSFLDPDEATEVTPGPGVASGLQGRPAAPLHALPVGTPHPARVDASFDPIHPGRAGGSSPAVEEKSEMAAKERGLRRSGSFDLPPTAPRKSSSWVAEAVLASAQRAGTTPPPPISGNVVPPPPVSGGIVLSSPGAAGSVTAAAAEVDTAPVSPPPRRALFAGAGLGVVAVLIIGLSARRCGGGTTQEGRKLATAPASQRQASKPAPPVSAVVAPATPRQASKPAPAVSPEVAPKPVAVTTPPSLTPPAPALREATAAVPSSSPAAQITAVPAAGATVPPTAAPASDVARSAAAGGGPAAAVAVSPNVSRDNSPNGTRQVPAVEAAPLPLPSPGAATGRAAAAPTQSPASTATTANPPPLPAAPKVAAVTAEGAAGSGPVDSDAEGDPTTTPAPVGKVMVLLSSNPPGAQVGTGRRQFGATPVSVKLKVGRSYALVFTREGYRTVTKQFRVTKFPDQQVVAVLHREQPVQNVQSNIPAAPQPPAKPERNWLQRMFGR